MDWIILTAFLALLGKLYVLWNFERNDWSGRPWLGLVIAFALLNLIEFVIYLCHFFDINASYTYLIKVYFVCATLCLSSAFNYVANNGVQYQKHINLLVHVAAVLICCAILFSDHIIGTYHDGSYPVRSEKGSAFLAFVVYSLGCVSLTVLVLLLNYKRAETVLDQVRYGYVLISFLPLTIAISTIVVLIAIGINANASMFIPLATTFFLLINIKGQVGSKITRDPRVFISPKSKASKLAREIDSIRLKLLLGDITYHDARSIIDSCLIESLVDQYDGNISKTERESGVKRSMIYRKLRK